MPAAPIHHRRILAGAVLLLILAAILAWRLNETRDPILGRWTYPHHPAHRKIGAYQFFPDGTLTADSIHGQWKLLPGPYYAIAPNVSPEVFETLLFSAHLTGYFLPSQVNEDRFQKFLAGNDLVRVPESANISIYEGSYGDGASVTAIDLFRSDDDLTIFEKDSTTGYVFSRPGNWLTRAWQSVREALHL